MQRLYDTDLDGCRRPLAVELLTYSKGLQEAKAGEIFPVSHLCGWLNRKDLLRLGCRAQDGSLILKVAGSCLHSIVLLINNYTAVRKPYWSNHHLQFTAKLLSFIEYSFTFIYLYPTGSLV